MANLSRWYPSHEVRAEWKWLLEASEYELSTTMLHCQQGPGNYHIAVVGGWGAKSLVFSAGGISMMEVTDRA